VREEREERSMQRVNVEENGGCNICKLTGYELVKLESDILAVLASL
jgi:hypothetical protein